MVTSKPKILVVDDDPRVAVLTRFTLNKAQLYETFIETRPRHAVEAVREIRPDLILLDVEMPGFSGGDVANALANEPALCSIPILFVTSLLSKTETGSHCLLRGDKHFLAKFVESAALIGAVEEMLAHGPPVS